MKRTRMNQVGARAKRRKKALDTAYRIVDERADGRCEAKIEGICSGRNEEHQHVGKRSVWPELVTNPDNILAICRQCHSEITANQNDHIEDGLHMPRTFENEVRFGLR